MDGVAAASKQDAGPEEAPLFVEILPRNTDENPSQAYAEAYVGTVDPQLCGTLIKRLSVALPLHPPCSTSSSSSSLNAPKPPDFSCLKRVKRAKASETEDIPSEPSLNGGASSNCGSQDQQPQAKKQRVTSLSSGDRQSTRAAVLQVLLGSVDQVEAHVASEARGDDDPSEFVNDVIVRTFQLRRLDRIVVPARPADSEEEWKEFQKVWPSSFFPHRTTEFRERSLQVSQEDIDHMKRGMSEALLDASRMASTSSMIRNGTVVVDPATGRTVAQASAEYVLQNTPRIPNVVARTNPLQTSIILAIQAVSRIERLHAERSTTMDGPEFQTGQYLCTGYDVYTIVEPSAYEAMALVHARIRRLVFGCRSSTDATSERRGVGGNGGITEHGVHALPGTNHKYRAFVCREGSSLWKACRDATCRPDS